MWHQRGCSCPPLAVVQAAVPDMVFGSLHPSLILKGGDLRPGAAGQPADRKRFQSRPHLSWSNMRSRKLDFQEGHVTAQWSRVL